MFPAGFNADAILDHIRYSRYMKMITCLRRANENAGNLISVVQFFNKEYFKK